MFLFLTSCKPGKQNSINLLLLLLNTLDNKNVNEKIEDSTNTDPSSNVNEEDENSINANANDNAPSDSDSSNPRSPDKNPVNPTSPNSSSADIGIKILSHSIFMAPTNLSSWGDLGQEERAQRIASSSYIKNQDIIVFEGLSHNNAEKILLEKIRSEYPYQTNVVGRTKKVGMQLLELIQLLQWLTEELSSLVNGLSKKKFNIYSTIQIVVKTSIIIKDLLM